MAKFSIKEVVLEQRFISPKTYDTLLKTKGENGLNTWSTQTVSGLSELGISMALGTDIDESKKDDVPYLWSLPSGNIYLGWSDGKSDKGMSVKDLASVYTKGIKLFYFRFTYNSREWLITIRVKGESNDKAAMTIQVKDGQAYSFNLPNANILSKFLPKVIPLVESDDQSLSPANAVKTPEWVNTLANSGKPAQSSLSKKTNRQLSRLVQSLDLPVSEVFFYPNTDQLVILSNAGYFVANIAGNKIRSFAPALKVLSSKKILLSRHSKFYEECLSASACCSDMVLYKVGGQTYFLPLN